MLGLDRESGRKSSPESGFGVRSCFWSSDGSQVPSWDR